MKPNQGLTIKAGAEDDFILASDADDRIWGGDGNDVLGGLDGHDTIHGEAGDDALFGNAGDDHLFGGTGNDLLVGGFGVETWDSDLLQGGAGDDLLRAGLGDDVVNGGSGTDRVSFFVDPVLNPAITTGVTVSLMIQGRAQNTGYGMKKIVNIEHLSGTAFADHLAGDDGANWLFGSGGDDVYFAHGGDDLITVSTGNESIDGGAGSDTIDLAGNGSVPGGVSVSLDLQGQWQATGQGMLHLHDVENLSGTDFDDVLIGDSDANLLAGASGNDVLHGGDGDDILLGDGALGLSGGSFAGGEIVRFEILPGVVGADVLVGGAGADTLIGGEGGDTFAYHDIGDSEVGSEDSILSFDAASGDRIDLSAIDADSSTVAEDAFSFVGNSAFTGTAGELRAEAADGGYRLMGDVDGDGAADFAIYVQADQPIAAPDLFL